MQGAPPPASPPERQRLGAFLSGPRVEGGGWRPEVSFRSDAEALYRGTPAPARPFALLTPTLDGRLVGVGGWGEAGTHMKGESPMAGYTCPLCGQDATHLGPHPQHSRKLIRHVDCPACGKFFVTEQAQDALRYMGREPHKTAMVSGVTRERAEQGSPITICSDSYDAKGQEPIGVRISEVLETMAPRSVTERLDRALLNLARKSRYPGDIVQVSAGKDYPLVFGEGPQTVDFMLDQMAYAGILDKRHSIDQGGGGYAVTALGWAKVDELRQPDSQTRQAFVAMWFDPQLDEAWKQGAEPGVRAAGYDPWRSDMDEFNDKICDRIIAEIRRSRFLVADVTGHRQAVYFEAGYAMGLGLPVIFTCREDDIGNCNFDTRQYNHIVWKSPGDLRDGLKNRIEATIV